jgi:hypothetical protein
MQRSLSCLTSSRSSTYCQVMSVGRKDVGGIQASLVVQSPKWRSKLVEVEARTPRRGRAHNDRSDQIDGSRLVRHRLCCDIKLGRFKVVVLYHREPRATA